MIELLLVIATCSLVYAGVRLFFHPGVDPVTDAKRAARVCQCGVCHLGKVAK